MSYKEGQFSKIVPIRWTKEDIKLREEFKCKHSHNGIQHPNCYNVFNGIEERKGCLDIESSNLKADFAITLSWTLKESGKDHYVYDHVTKEDLNSGIYDARIVASLIDEIWKYDRLIGHYCKNGYFDIPFIRARYLWLLARKLYKGTRFPGYGEMWVTDTYTMAKPLLTISSKRQNNIANVIQGKDIKTVIDKDHWMAIQNGSPKQRKAAIDYIVEHNIKDAEQLDANYLLLLPFIKPSRVSI
jgi:hypothetical protein